MSILTSARRQRLLVQLVTLAASLSAAAVVGALGAPTATAASAARCNTPGHAYLTATGRPALTSGFEGDQRNGLPTWTYTQGQESFRLGGNGLSPGSSVEFFIFDANNNQVGFVWGRGSSYFTRGARSNCVVNEEGPYTFTLPPGIYRVQANYFPGNNFRLVTDVLGYLNVLAPPPPPPYEPPPYEPPDPCSPVFFCL